MKYQSYATLSSVIGIIFAILSYLVLSFVAPDNALLLAALAGLLMILLMFPIFIITDKVGNLKYNKFEKSISDKIIHKIGANIQTEKGVRFAKIYLTEKGLIIASSIKKNIVGEFLPFCNIYKIITDKLVSIEIYTRDNKMLNMASPEASELLDAINKVSRIVNEYKD